MLLRYNIVLDDAESEPARRLQQQKHTLQQTQVDAADLEAEPLKQQIMVTSALGLRRRHHIQHISHVQIRIKHDWQRRKVEHLGE